MIEDIVAESAGVLAWGGHLEQPDQGLLYVTAPPSDADATRLAREYDAADRMDSAGGVGQIDVFSPER